MKTFLATMTFLLLVGVAQTMAQRPDNRQPYGSVYRNPYGGVSIGQPRYTGSYQTLPYGQRVYTAPIHPFYTGYYGRYSPSPPLPKSR